MRGGDLKALQEILGHTTLTMIMKYAHLAPGHKQEAINRLNGLTTKNLIVTKWSQSLKLKNQQPCKSLILLVGREGIEPSTY